MSEEDPFLDDDEMDAWLDEWEAVDREAAEYLAERIEGLLEPLNDLDARWVVRVAETFNPPGFPEEESEIEVQAAVVSLEHADLLALALGAVRRGPGAIIDAETLLTDVAALDDIDGEVEDTEGFLMAIEMALIALTLQWQRLGVLDEDERLTARGVWGLPRAIHLNWTNSGESPDQP